MIFKIHIYCIITIAGFYRCDSQIVTYLFYNRSHLLYEDIVVIRDSV